MKKPKAKPPGGKWVFVPDTSEEAVERRMHEVMTGLALFTTDFPSRVAAAEQFTDYFPGSNEVPAGGAWILIKTPPPCEYTVPPFSLWFAEPWPMERQRHDAHRVKVVTPRGSLGVFPREYALVEHPEKYFEFIGAGMEIKFFGGNVSLGKLELPLFYIRSRGISKRDALAMLLGSIKAPGICWIESTPETCAAFGAEWPAPSQLATLTGASACA